MADAEEGDGPEFDPIHLQVPGLLPGDRCLTAPGGRPAQVKYVGFSLQGMPKGYWIGVQYDEKVGKNDGRCNGRRYFRCPPGHGGFVRASRVTRVWPRAKPHCNAFPWHISPLITHVPRNPLPFRSRLKSPRVDQRSRRQ